MRRQGAGIIAPWVRISILRYAPYPDSRPPWFELLGVSVAAPMIICHILSYTRACTQRKKEEREKKRGREKSSTRFNTSREDPSLPKTSGLTQRGARPAGSKFCSQKISYVGSTHSPFRHVREAAKQAK